MIVSKATALKADGTLKDGYTSVVAKTGRIMYMTCVTPECQLKHNTRLNQKIQKEEKPKRNKLTKKDIEEAKKANAKVALREAKKANKGALTKTKDEWITIGGKKKDEWITIGGKKKSKPLTERLKYEAIDTAPMYIPDKPVKPPRPATGPAYPYQKLRQRPKYETIDTASMYIPRDKPSKRYLKNIAMKAEKVKKVKPPKRTNKKSIISKIDKPLPSPIEEIIKAGLKEASVPKFKGESPLYKSKETIKKRKTYAKAIKSIKKLDAQKATKSAYSKTNKDEKTIRKLLGIK
jgi:hypothetical protein